MPLVSTTSSSDTRNTSQLAENLKKYFRIPQYSDFGTVESIEHYLENRKLNIPEILMSITESGMLFNLFELVFSENFTDDSRFKYLFEPRASYSILAFIAFAAGIENVYKQKTPYQGLRFAQLLSAVETFTLVFNIIMTGTRMITAPEGLDDNDVNIPALLSLSLCIALVTAVVKSTKDINFSEYAYQTTMDKLLSIKKNLLTGKPFDHDLDQALMTQLIKERIETHSAMAWYHKAFKVGQSIARSLGVSAIALQIVRRVDPSFIKPQKSIPWQLASAGLGAAAGISFIHSEATQGEKNGSDYWVISSLYRGFTICSSIIPSLLVAMLPPEGAFYTNEFLGEKAEKGQSFTNVFGIIVITLFALSMAKYYAFRELRLHRLATSIRQERSDIEMQDIPKPIPEKEDEVTSEAMELVTYEVTPEREPSRESTSESYVIIEIIQDETPPEGTAISSTSAFSSPSKSFSQKSLGFFTPISTSSTQSTDSSSPSMLGVP